MLYMKYKEVKAEADYLREEVDNFIKVQSDM
jgi:hypothetical protein